MKIKLFVGMLLLMMAAQAGAQTKPISGVISAHPATSAMPSHAASSIMPDGPLACRGFGTQGGEYVCYAEHDSASVDCVLDRYLNETPIAQMCGQFKLPVKMTKPESGTVTLSAESVSSKKK